ncbi:helix-turn-helix transcriptional regulator [Paenibacillus odorifer]|uniref:helix-turn-helix transcriptional regulator n=1 Tax=Paenibacillus odorifer TaxID=189426 RepID=UPI00096C7DDC|nr:helix-turn-helix transcriptional regulator [Paenibacillus odorifer]
MGYYPGRCLLARRLREIDKSQQWLSDVTGISKSQISDYVTNRRIMSLSTAMTISKAVKCSMDDLYEFVHE